MELAIINVKSAEIRKSRAMYTQEDFLELAGTMIFFLSWTVLFSQIREVPGRWKEKDRRLYVSTENRVKSPLDQTTLREQPSSGGWALLK